MEERHTPVCFRQIGRSSDREHVYVEDYVKSYLEHLSESYTEEGCIFAVYGQERVVGGVREWYVDGASAMSLTMGDLGVVSKESVQREVEDYREQYFPEMHFLGWFFCMPAMLAEECTLYEAISKEWSPGRDICFLTCPIYDRQLHIYLVREGEVGELPGFYIYYEKNTAMQEYMVEQREKMVTEEAEIVLRDRETSVEAIRAKFREERKPRRIRPRMSRLTLATVIMTATFLVLLGTFVFLQHDDIDQVVAAVQEFTKNIISSKK